MIGQIYHYNSFASKKYYLCLFFTLIIGFKSFENLKTIHNYLYFTFEAACVALDFLEDDEEKKE